MIAQRLDTMLTGVPTISRLSHHNEISFKLNELAPKMGRYIIKRMHSGTTANQIRAYLKELELKTGIVPDVLIVDYLDIMGANGRVSAENVFEKDKQAAEQLRDIGLDYKMIVASASQQNRDAVKDAAKGDPKDINHSHIAGGISKINTVDWVISIILTPIMKAAGEMIFLFLKTRSSDGVGKQCRKKWNNTRLLIENFDPQDNQQSAIENKVAQAKKPQPSQNLLDIMGDF